MAYIPQAVSAHGLYLRLAAVTGNVLAGALLSVLSGGTINGTTPVAEVPDNMKILERAFAGDKFGQVVDLLQNDEQDKERPASHLNYMVMDEEMNVIKEQSGALQIKGEGQWEAVAKDGQLVISRPGYLTIFTSNRSLLKTRWDLVRLIQYRGSAVEENFYYIVLKKQKRVVDTVYIEDMSKGYSYLPSMIENAVIVRCDFNFIKNKLKKGGFGIRILRAIELSKDGVSVSVGEYAAYKKKKRVNYDKGMDYQVFYRYSGIDV